MSFVNSANNEGHLPRLLQYRLNLTQRHGDSLRLKIFRRLYLEAVANCVDFSIC